MHRHPAVGRFDADNRDRRHGLTVVRNVVDDFAGAVGHERDYGRRLCIGWDAGAGTRRARTTATISHTSEMATTTATTVSVDVA